MSPVISVEEISCQITGFRERTTNERSRQFVTISYFHKAQRTSWIPLKLIVLNAFIFLVS